MTHRLHSRLRWACLIVAPVFCVSCSDIYLARRDTLTMSTGDAVTRNMAVHTIDPWPRAAERTDDIVSGERLQRGIERYRNPSPASGAGGLGVGAVGAVPLTSTSSYR